jgi:hypothetical protein
LGITGMIGVGGGGQHALNLHDVSEGSMGSERRHRNESARCNLNFHLRGGFWFVGGFPGVGRGCSMAWRVIEKTR